MRTVVPLMLILVLAALLAEPQFGRSDESARGEPDPMLVTPEREAAALTFARLHHPELEKLLVRLRKQNPGEFRKAARQLYQTSERLARIKERDPERYALQLELWQLDSRIRLLAARMTMTSDPALEAKLRELLGQRQEARVRQLQLERSRLASRLAKVDEALGNLQSDPAASVERELERLKKSLPKRPRKPSRKEDTQAVSTKGKDSNPPGRRGAKP